VITTQWGSEANPFSIHNGLEKMKAVEDIVRLAAEVSSQADCQITLSYGTLLGAMRGGNLVPHDYDFDLAFFPNSMKGEDLIATSKKVIQVCKNLGLRTKEESHGHLTAFIEISGVERAVDFFAGWVSSGLLMHYFAINGEISESDFFPIKTGFLCGIRVPIPRNPSKVLQAIYGDSWEFPDEHFVHQPNFENFSFLLIQT